MLVVASCAVISTETQAGPAQSAPGAQEPLLIKGSPEGATEALETPSPGGQEEPAPDRASRSIQDKEELLQDAEEIEERRVEVEVDARPVKGDSSLSELHPLAPKELHAEVFSALLASGELTRDDHDRLSKSSVPVIASPEWDGTDVRVHGGSMGYMIQMSGETETFGVNGRLSVMRNENAGVILSNFEAAGKSVRLLVEATGSGETAEPDRERAHVMLYWWEHGTFYNFWMVCDDVAIVAAERCVERAESYFVDLVTSDVSDAGLRPLTLIERYELEDQASLFSSSERSQATMRRYEDKSIERVEPPEEGYIDGDSFIEEFPEIGDYPNGDDWAEVNSKTESSSTEVIQDQLTESQGKGRYVTLGTGGPYTNPCPLETSARPGYSAHGTGCLRVCVDCVDVMGKCPGPNDTLACINGATGGSNTASFVRSEQVFPIGSLLLQGDSYANSQVFAPGGGGSAAGGSASDPLNFSMPWEDNFCEWRTSTQPASSCGPGLWHRGQDIRPRTNQVEIYPVVATEKGIAISVPPAGSTSFSVSIARGGIETIYKHMTKYQISQGNDVNTGQRIGLVNKYFGGAQTTIHLHYAIRENGTYMNPYNSLKVAYDKRWYVRKSHWDNNQSYCVYGLNNSNPWYDWDFARYVNTIANGNWNCGSTDYEANAFVNDGAIICSFTNPCEVIYLSADCGIPNSQAYSFDPRLEANWVGDGLQNYPFFIYQIQYDLMKAGYNSSSNLDCQWGANTKSAIQSFQFCNGLSVTGIVAGRTWEKLVSPNNTVWEC